jgi:dCMP deaminase
MARLERDEYYAAVVTLTAERSSCCRASVGAIAIQDRRIVATGYNGPAPGIACSDEPLGCDAGELEGCQRAIHAESNLVAWAARAGIQLQGATVWSTHSPCRSCAQLLLGTGIESFVFIHHYRLGRPDLLADGGVEVSVWDQGLHLWHPITHGF